MKTQKYTALSPDGFPIQHDAVFNSKKQANDAVLDWIKSYEVQGYYSTIKNGERFRIPVSDIQQHCKIIKLTHNETIY